MCTVTTTDNSVVGDLHDDEQNLMQFLCVFEILLLQNLQARVLLSAL
jgi:hypothetical protein